MEDEQLKEQLEIELKSFSYQRDLIRDIYLTEIVEKSADQILNLIKQAGCIMPGEKKALKEQIAKFVPVQLEVLSDEELLVVREGARRVSTLDLSTPIWWEQCQRDTIQATIAKNSKEQLYRKVKRGRP